jgi:hypothetical protein
VLNFLVLRHFLMQKLGGIGYFGSHSGGDWSTGARALA